MSASVVVPGFQSNRKPNDSDELGNKKSRTSQNKQDGAYEGPMSVIQDCETVNEQDTVQEEDVGSDEEKAQRHPPHKFDKAIEENVPDSHDLPVINLGRSVLSNDEQLELLRRSIAERASILQEEEVKRSALNSQLDAEMKDETRNNQMEEFEEVAVEECSPSEEDLDDELRDEADGDLSDHLEQI